MNATTLAQSAYKNTTKLAPSSRDIEYRALARVTADMSKHANADPLSFPKLALALHENLMLWTALAQDVASDANQFPVKLRAQIFYLAEFTRLHSAKIIRNQATIGALVEINRSIMRGLNANQVES